MTGQGQQDFLSHQVIQLNRLINQPEVEILCAQFMLLFVPPGDATRKSLGKLHIDRELHVFQTTAAGDRNLCVQLAADFDLTSVASNSPLDLNRLDIGNVKGLGAKSPIIAA
jgi:hypothetical protein